MINLLPNSQKKQIKAARSNVLLVRYAILLGVSSVFLMLAIASVYILMTTIKTNAENSMSENQTRISKYAAVEAEAAQFRGNLKIAKTILDKEVVYSKAILNIAQALPAGIVIDALALDANTFGTPTTLAARAKTYNDAVALKDNLEKSNVFSNVHFASISSAATPGEQAATDAYPYSVTINLVIDKGIASR